MYISTLEKWIGRNFLFFSEFGRGKKEVDDDDDDRDDDDDKWSPQHLQQRRPHCTLHES
jgi:hypothetical protein